MCDSVKLVNKFSKSEAIKFGWNTTKKNFPFLLKVYLIAGVISVLGNTTYYKVKLIDFDFVTNFLIQTALWILTTIISMGLIKIALKFTDDQKPNISDLYRQYPLFFKYFAGEILAAIAAFLGFILLIVPGIILFIKLYFVNLLIIDKGFGPIQAIKKSWKMTQGQFWNLFLFGLALLGLNILGALALLIGLLWTIPTTSIATAYVYRKLSPK